MEVFFFFLCRPTVIPQETTRDLLLWTRPLLEWFCRHLLMDLHFLHFYTFCSLFVNHLSFKERIQRGLDLAKSSGNIFKFVVKSRNIHFILRLPSISARSTPAMPVFTCVRARPLPAWTAASTGKIAKIRKFTEHVLPELHRFTGVKYPEGRTSLYIFFPQPLFHFNCARDLRVPTARDFHAPQLIQRRAEKTRAWPLYSSPETDKLDLTPLNKKEVWFRSGFLPPQGGLKGRKGLKERE